MKKILLAAAVASTLASSAFAEEGTFYARVDVGASHVRDHKSSINTVDPVTAEKEVVNFKFKANTNVVVKLGVGTYLMDNVRTELALGYYANAEQKVKGEDTKAKFNAMNLSLKGLVDVMDFGYGQLFVGAGVGVTQLGAKYTVNGELEAGESLAINKAKRKTNFSFLATAGLSMEVADGVKADLTYSYNDHGKVKAADYEITKKVGDTTESVSKGQFKALAFQTHDLTLGLRFEM